MIKKSFKERILSNDSIHIDDVNQILKNQEKAEKYDKIKEKYDYAQEDIQISLNLAIKNTLTHND